MNITELNLEWARVDFISGTMSTRYWEVTAGIGREVVLNRTFKTHDEASDFALSLDASEIIDSIVDEV